MTPTFFPFCVRYAVLVSILCVAVTAQAQLPIFWDGSGADNNWTTLSNWATSGTNTVTDPVAIPGATDDVVFYSTGGARLTTNVVNAPFTLRSLTFGNGQSGAVTIGGTSVLTLDGLLNYNSSILSSGAVAGLTTPGTLRTGIYVQAGSGATTISAPITLGNAQQWVNNSSNLLLIQTGALTNGANDLTIGGSGNTTISSAFTGAGTGGLTKFGAGTLTLSGVNTYTGATTVNFGTLNLGGGTATGSLSASSALRMGGGTFTYSRTGTNTQTVNGLTVNSGASTINNTVATNILNLGAITRAAGNGTINFGTTTGQIRTTATNTNGIIGPWATFGTGTNLRYAVSNGATAAITGLAGTTATANLANVTLGTTNYDYAAAVTTAANLQGNTLRYTGGATTTALGANTLTLNGLMNAGTGLLTVTGATGGGLLAGSTGELAIATNTQGITISAVVGGTGGVTYSSGGGTLILSGANTYTGVTTVNSGILQMGNAAALGTVAGGTVVASGGALNINNQNVTNLEALTINGAGSGATPRGALTNSSATAGTWNGAITLGSNASIGLSGAGGLTLSATATIALGSNTLSFNIGGAGNVTTAGVISGTGGVSSSSTGGTVILNGANTYTGVTNVNSGVLQMGNAAALGTVAGGTFVASGGALNVNGQNVTNQEQLTINGAGSGATPRGALTNGSTTNATWSGAITLGSNASIGLNSSGNLLLGSTAGINLGSNTLTINIGGAGNVTTTGVISGAGGVVSSGSGTGLWATTSNHTYSGGTVLTPGSFTATNTSSAGPIGSPTSGPFGQGVLELAGGSLRSTTALATTIDNAVTISGNTTFNGVAGEKNLTLRGPVTLTGGNRTLTSTLGTVVPGTSVTFAGNIGEIGTSGLIKAGAGNLVLSGLANTYSGGTTVNAGLLNITGGLAGTGNITVASTGYLSLISNSANAINTTGALNLGTAAGTAILGLDLGTSFDSLTGAAAATTAGNVYFNINPSAGFGAGTYTLLSSPAGGLEGATYGLGSLPSGFAYTLTPSATEVILNVTSGAPAATDFYWGAGNGSWATNANWFSDVAGTTPAGATPSLGSSVFFNTTTATGPTIATTLDAPFTVDNLRFNANPSGITALTISSGNNVNNNLTISPVASTDGIALGANNGVVTISAPITLGTPQTWTVDGTTGTATSSLVVSGLISGPATSTISFNAANSNPAQITLSAVGGNPYSGASTIGANMNVVGGSVGAFSVNTNWTVNGTLSTGAFAQSTGSLIGGSGIVQNGSATNATLTIGNDNLGTSPSPVTFAGTIQNGSTGALGVTKVGTGVQVFSGTNIYTGTTTISAGTLRNGSTTTFGSAGIGNGALALAGTGAFDLNGFNAAVTNVSASVVGSSITNAGTSDATLAISAQANTISSLITDGATNKLAVTLRSNNTGATPFLLTSANTFSGGLTLVDGTALGAGTRLTINGAVTTVGAPGAITSSPFGTGTITIGQAATDKAGIFFSTVSNELRNDIVFNTALGTDRVGIRSDIGGVILSGRITANLAPATFTSNNPTLGSFTLTNQVTGASGLVLDITSLAAAATTFNVTLNNQTVNPNNYSGDTVVNLNAATGKSATLTLGAANQIPNGVGRGNLVLNTTGTGVGLLNMAGFNETINGLNGSGTVDGTSGTPTLTVGDGNATGNFSGILRNTAGSLSLTKIGSGTQTLSGASTYSGLTTVNDGTLSFSASDNLGDASATNNVTLSGGTLQYTGSGAVALGANRQFTVTSGTTATVETQNAVGNLQITAGGIVTTGASAATNFTKSGPGTLTVTGVVDLQSGGVNVTGGTLLAGLHASNTGTINVVSSGSLQLVDNSAVNLTLMGTGTGSLTLSNGRLGFELGASGVNDMITMTGVNFATASGINTFDFYGLGGFGVGSYDLLAAPGGLTSGGATYILGNAPSGFNYVITSTDTLVSLQTSVLSNIYWTNSQTTGSWNTVNGGPLTNFSTDLAGATNYTLVPQATDTVIFSSTAASVGASPINTTLDAAFTVDSLRFTNQPADATVSIAAGTGGALTLAPVSAANGITVDSNGGAVTISAPLTAGTAQTWSVDGTGTSSLALSGDVVLTGNVTKTGAGTLTLSGAANTGAGNFTLADGTLIANSNGALGTGTFTMNNNTTLDNTGAGAVTLTGSANTWNGNFTYIGGTQSLDLGTGAVSLGANAQITVGGNTLTVGGGITDGVNAFGLTKLGAGTLVLNGNNTLDGPITINAGTLTLGGTNTFTGLVSVNAGTLNLGGNNSGAGGVTLAAGASLNLDDDGALGTGRLTLDGGTINSSNAARTLANNNVQTWGNGATVVSTGANTLNLGTGQVTMGTNATTGSFTLTNNATSGTPSLTVGGDISAVAGGTAGIKTLTIAGTGNTALTGNITRGAASGIVVTNTLPGTATLTLSGAASTITTLNLNAATGTSIVDIGTGNLTLANGGFNSLQSTTGGVINATGGGVLTLGAVNDNWGTANGTTLTINARITGAATNSLESFAVNNGTGIMFLANDANDFAGNTAINSGVVRVSSINDVGVASGLGAGNGNGSISIGSGAGTTGTLNYVGSGGTTNRVFNLSGTTAGGTIDLTGSTTTSASPLKFTANATATGAGIKTLTLTGAASTFGEFAGAIVNNSGTNTTAVTKSGDGTWTFSGANTYSGATTIQNGTLALIGGDNRLAAASSVTLGAGATSGRLVLGDTSAAINQTIGGLISTGLGGSVVGANASTNSVLTVNNSAANVFGGTLGGAGTNENQLALVKTNSGDLNLSGVNTYVGGTTLSGGTITAANNSALGTGDFTFSGSGVRLLVSDGVTISNNITIGTNAGGASRGLIENSGSGNGTLSGGTITINTGAAAGGTFASSATGTLTVASPINSPSVTVTVRTGTVILSGGGTYNNFFVTGTARLGANNGLSTSAIVDVAPSGAGNFDLAGFNQQLVGITRVNGANAGIIGNSSTTSNSMLTTTGTSVFSGVIQNVLGVGTQNVGLTVNGGDLTLSGVNTFTGGTFVTAGQLNLGNATNTLANTGALTVNGGTLAIGTNSDTVGAVTLTSGSITGTTGVLTGASYDVQSGTVSANLGGTGIAMTKNTAGTVSLSGANTYSGTTSINAGTLQVSGGSAIANAGLITLANATDATLQVVGSETIGALSGGGATGGNVALDALQTLTLSAGGGNTYAGTISGAGAITLSGGNQTLNGDLSHTGGVNVTGNGVLTLGSSTNTYTGVTAIGAGAGRSLLVTADGALGATGTGNETTIGPNGQLGLSGGITYSATEKIIGSGVGNTAGQAPFTNVQRGFIQSVSGNNTFAGDIEINAGGISRIGTQEGAQLNLTGKITQATGSILFRSGSITGDFVTLSNSGNTFGGDSQVFSAATGIAGNYAGVRLGVSNALPTNLTISGLAGSGAGAALDLNGNDQALNGLINGDQFKIINLDTGNSSTLTLNPTSDTTTTNTTILGGGGLGVINLVKDGAFTQTLNGANTYTGTTTITAGSLIVNNTSGSGTGSGNVIVKDTATLGGTGTIAGATFFEGGSTHAAGNSPGLQTFGGDLTYNSDGISVVTVDWELISNSTTAADFDRILVGGVLNFANDTTLSLDFQSAGSTVDWSDSFWATDKIGTNGWLVYSGATSLDNIANLSIGGNLLDQQGDALSSVYSTAAFSIFTSGNNVYLNYVTAVPEPGTIGVLGLAGLALAVARRRKARKAKAQHDALAQVEAI